MSKFINHQLSSMEIPSLMNLAPVYHSAQLVSTPLRQINRFLHRRIHERRTSAQERQIYSKIALPGPDTTIRPGWYAKWNNCTDCYRFAEPRTPRPGTDESAYNRAQTHGAKRNGSPAIGSRKSVNQSSQSREAALASRNTPNHGAARAAAKRQRKRLSMRNDHISGACFRRSFSTFLSMRSSVVVVPPVVVGCDRKWAHKLGLFPCKTADF